jgi:hypothetical protein
MSTLELLKKMKPVSESSDQILDTSSEIESLNKEDAEEMVLELLDSDNYNAFKLGGVLSVIKANGWFDGYKDYKSYVSEKFGLEYRKAQYWIGIYDKLVGESISWVQVKDLKWTKVSILVPVLTAANVDEWVAKAMNVNCDTLKAMVKAALSSGDAEDEEAPITSEVSKLAFTVHADQKEIIKGALEKAKTEVETTYDTVALENICLGYLSGSVAVDKSLKDQMAAAGYEHVLSIFSDLWPEIGLVVTA